MRWVVFAIVLAGAADARAGNDLENWLVGPVFAIQIGGHPNSRGVIGVEGGGGYGPERFNVGFEHRGDGKTFAYADIDPWYLLGGTLGFGFDSDGKVEPVVGVWEGLPLNHAGSCEGWHPQLSISAGYRYTGVHELYVSIKAGEMNGNVCFD